MFGFFMLFYSASKGIWMQTIPLPSTLQISSTTLSPFAHLFFALNYYIIHKDHFLKKVKHINAEHLASPKPGTNKNWFGTSHFVKHLVRK